MTNAQVIALALFSIIGLVAYVVVQIIETHYLLKMHSRDIKRLKAMAEGEKENV